MYLALSPAIWRQRLTLLLTLLSQAEGVGYLLLRDCCCCAMQSICHACCGQTRVSSKTCQTQSASVQDLFKENLFTFCDVDLAQRRTWAAQAVTFAAALREPLTTRYALLSTTAVPPAFAPCSEPQACHVDLNSRGAQARKSGACSGQYGRLPGSRGPHLQADS